MESIQMVDLISQYSDIKDEVLVSIEEICEKAQFINGPAVQEFQKDLEKYLNVKHVIPCANGTDALQIALMALDLQPGDEVITPSFTYIATTEVIALLRLKPVFVEVNNDNFCMNIQSLKAAIGPNTKAIVPVHLYGQAANMEEIMAVAKEHDLKVIEDNAQAIGCNYHFSDGRIQKTMTIGDIGCTSFFPSKNLGCYGDGGAIATNNDELAAKMRMIANHGQSKRYYHDLVGCNSRLDTIQAAILRIKLRKLDEYNARRNGVAKFYDNLFEAIDQIQAPARNNYSDHVFHQYTIKLCGINRDEFIAHLSDHGIPSMIYYPIPGHRQKMFSSFELAESELPVTDELTSCVMSLPIHTEFKQSHLEKIAEAVNSFVNKTVIH